MDEEAELEYLRFFYREAGEWFRDEGIPHAQRYIAHYYEELTGLVAPEGYRGD